MEINKIRKENKSYKVLGLSRTKQYGNTKPAIAVGTNKIRLSRTKQYGNLNTDLYRDDWKLPGLSRTKQYGNTILMILIWRACREV